MTRRDLSHAAARSGSTQLFLSVPKWHLDCSVSTGFMRVRILRQPPPSYDEVTATLRVGRVYNLDSAVASALLCEGIAEAYDVLSPEEKRRKRAGANDLWQAADRRGRWFAGGG
jgi:hypothetical protein